MLLKMLDTFLKELPRLELGDASTRAHRLLTWKVAVQQQITPAGRRLKAWWKWCIGQAETTYDVFLLAGIHEREAIVPKAQMPVEWEQLESWMRPKVIECLPKDIREWTNMRGRLGYIDDSHILLFHLMSSA